MPCFVVLLVLVAPRLGIALLWLVSHWFDGLFTSLLWPIIGFVFLPVTLLWYTAVQHWFGGEWAGFLPIAGLIITLMIDLSPARARSRRKRTA
ncbi:MAG: hypothetical protein ACRELE_02580 [Gemmatimonadales bacterium]